MKQKRMNIGAVVCGVVCALCVLAYTHIVTGQADAARAEAMARYGGEQIEVCVATKDIAPGETVNSTNTTTKLWLTDLLPAHAISNYASVDGATVGSTILAGEVLSEPRFNTTSGEIQVPEGLCALSVSAKDVQAVGGAVKSGMHVDVYAVGATSTALIGSDVLVITSSAEDAANSGSNTWVTLAVDPTKVQEFIASTKSSDLYFALPGSDKVTTKGVSDDA